MNLYMKRWKNICGLRKNNKSIIECDDLNILVVLINDNLCYQPGK